MPELRQTVSPATGEYQGGSQHDDKSATGPRARSGRAGHTPKLRHCSPWPVGTYVTSWQLTCDRAEDSARDKPAYNNHFDSARGLVIVPQLPTSTVTKASHYDRLHHVS